jgi:hypothetical protein
MPGMTKRDLFRQSLALWPWTTVSAAPRKRNGSRMRAILGRG